MKGISKSTLLILANILSLGCSYYLSLLPKAVPKRPKCCYFTGAGIYFFWQLGCAQYIKESCDFKDVPIIVGASAGSLTAAFLLADADLRFATKKALELAESSKIYDRKSGLAGIWGILLKEWLEAVIPDEVSKEDFKTLQIALTPALKSFKLVKNFESKADLIAACLASCHVPIFLDGRPFTEYRGEQVVDGSFWYFITKNRETGLPLPENVKVDEVLWIDYGDDEKFMRSISGNFLSLITPAEVLDMVEAGYNYMKLEHFQGRLPIARNQFPNFVNFPPSVSFKTALAEIPTRFESMKSYASSTPLVKWLTTGITATAITTTTASSQLGFEIDSAAIGKVFNNMGHIFY